MRKIRGFLMRPHDAMVEQTIKRLIRVGERIHGTEDSAGHLVQEYVQQEMLKNGMRIKVHPKELGAPLPEKGQEYYAELYEKIYGK